MLSVSMKFYPMRMAAYTRNEVELEISVENKTGDYRWVECDVLLPEAISLAPDKTLTKGRVRIGIIKPGDFATKKMKVYGGASSYPDTYAIRMTAYGFGSDGTISEREEKKHFLRCTRLGEEE